jgi:predicted aspartyl protease
MLSFEGSTEMRMQMVVVWLACVLTGSVASAWGGASDGSVSIDIYTETGHIVMPAWIGGDGPYWFVLDTGNQNTTIFADLAEELGLETSPLGEMGGWFGCGW